MELRYVQFCWRTEERKKNNEAKNRNIQSGNYQKCKRRRKLKYKNQERLALDSINQKYNERNKPEERQRISKERGMKKCWNSIK